MNQLQVHRQKHANPEKQCRFCEKALSSRYMVNYNIRLKPRGNVNFVRNHHDALNPFACKRCDRTFLTKHNMSMHSAKHQEHNVHFVCDKCGNRFQYKRNLYLHMKQNFWNKG